MNNNMNNQGANNSFPTNESGTFTNNEPQPISQPFINNNFNNNFNENNQGVNNSFTPNQTGTFANNGPQQNEQPFINNNFNNNYNQNNQGVNNSFTPNQTGTFVNNNLNNTESLNNNENIQNLNSIPNNSGKKFNKKNILIAAGAIIILIVLISLFSNSSKISIPSAPNAKLTLNCTANVTMAGVYYTDTYDMYINDGSISTKQTYRMDLKKTQINGNEDEWAQSYIDGLSAECKSTPGCKFDYDYSKGNYFETITFLEEENYSEGVQGLTAEEIYDLFKANLEGGKVDGLKYTCSGNGTTTGTESVYKIIDFNSYTGDSESTEFDILFNKKVTFTNVPTFGGYFGNLNNNIFCDNESSFTIEDDAKYTITGIVTLNQGTAIVKLKDCTITKTN